jgi:hypothetical protein
LFAPQKKRAKVRQVAKSVNQKEQFTIKIITEIV